MQREKEMEAERRDRSVTCTTSLMSLERCTLETSKFKFNDRKQNDNVIKAIPQSIIVISYIKVM